MKKYYYLIALALLIFVFNLPVLSAGSYFVENRGQVNSGSSADGAAIICYGELRGGTVYVTTTGLSFVVVSPDCSGEDGENERTITMKNVPEDREVNVRLIRTDLPVPGFTDSGRRFLGRMDFYSNFYTPENKDGILNVPAYSTVDYPGVANGAGLQLSLRRGKLVVSVGRSPEGEQLYRTLLQAVKEKGLEEVCQVGFAGESTEDEEGKNSLPAIQGFNNNIAWATYTGGSLNDYVYAIAIDSLDNIFVGGTTYSLDFSKIYKPGYPRVDVNGSCFICKYDKFHNIKWVTFMGCIDISKITTAADNTIWFCGSHYWEDNTAPFTDNAYVKLDSSGVDGVIGKLTEKGKIEYLTEFGGEQYDYLNDIHLDSAGNVFIFGYTESKLIPITQNAMKKKIDGTDLIIIKFSPDYRLLYSSYWGGSARDMGISFDFDIDGNIIVFGETNSSDYPTKNPVQKYNSKSDLVLTKFDKNFNVVWSTFYGGSDNDRAKRMVVDHHNNILVSGTTRSKDFGITKNAIQEYLKGYWDQYVAKFDMNGKLVWSTYYGSTESWETSELSVGGGIHVDTADNVVVTDCVAGTGLYVSPDAYQRVYQDKRDAFLLVLDSLGGCVYSSYFGGSELDYGSGIAFNSRDELVICGTTYSRDIVDIDSSSKYAYNGMYEGFIVQFGPKDIYDCDETSFSYPDFTDDKNIIYVGNATPYKKMVRLTEANYNRMGAIWYKHLVPVKQGFSTVFSFRISNGYNGRDADTSQPGADGFAFVIQNNKPNIVGLAGGHIGYAPLKNSLAVEFDLFSNDKNQIESLFDPNGNHIAVMSKGKEANSANHSSGSELGIVSSFMEIMSNSDLYYGKIDYNVEYHTIRVFISNSFGYFTYPILKVDNVDLEELLDLYQNEWAYVGFTAATGSSFQDHKILSWDFCPKETDGVQTGVDDEISGLLPASAVYPNPAEGLITVGVGDRQGIIVITNCLGETAMCLTAKGNASVDVSGLPAGCYFLKVQYDDGHCTFGKFLKK